MTLLLIQAAFPFHLTISCKILLAETKRRVYAEQITLTSVAVLLTYPLTGPHQASVTHQRWLLLTVNPLRFDEVLVRFQFFSVHLVANSTLGSLSFFCLYPYPFEFFCIHSCFWSVHRTQKKNRNPDHFQVQKVVSSKQTNSYSTLF